MRDVQDDVNKPKIALDMMIGDGDSVTNTWESGPPTHCEMTAYLSSGQIQITGKNLTLERYREDTWVLRFS